MSIGPQIPPHLLASRAGAIRDDDNDNRQGPSIGPVLPAHIQRQKSESSSEEDSPGPSIGPALPSPQSKREDSVGLSIGPALPSHLRHSKPDNDYDKITSVGPSIGPTLPPHLRRSKLDEDNDELSPAPTPKPAPPAHRVEHLDDDDDDSDDDIGPKPLPAHLNTSYSMNDGVREFLEKEERRKRNIEEASKPKPLKRDEWMLVPPTSDLLHSLSDISTLKKPRHFRSSTTASSSKEPNNLWTETPAERAQRIADEVHGRKRRAANADPDADDMKGDSGETRAKRLHVDAQIRSAISSHTATARGKSLYDMHSSNSKSNTPKDADDAPPGVWDHTRDMAPGGRLMDDKARSKLVSDAKALGDRFGSGKSGSFL